MQITEQISNWLNHWFSEEITVDNFTVNDAKTQITAVVPTHAKEGSIQLVAFSGVKVSAATPLSLVGPAVTSISPKPVKMAKQLQLQEPTWTW